jgi:signal transduction histidine kinase
MKMMRPIRFFIGLFFIGSLLFGQNEKLKKTIDSLNHQSYEKKIETSGNNIQKYLDNLSLAKKISYPMGIAESYANLSMIYYYKGEYDVGVGYFLKAVDKYKELGEYGKAGGLYGLYGYRFRRQNLTKAIEYMNIGIRMAEKAGAEDELRSLYDNYGVVLEDSGNYDSAFYYYYKSLDMKRKTNDEVGIPYSLNKIAALKSILGDYKGAKVIFDEAYQRRLKLNDKVGIAENLSFYGTFYEMQKDYDNALKYFREALEVSKEAGYNWLTSNIYNSLAENSKEKNDYKNAFVYLKEHMAYKDSIYNMESTVNRNQLEVQFETNEKEKKILEQRADLAEQRLEIEHKNMFLYGLGFLVLLIALTGFMIYRTQKLRNEQLKRENLLKDSLIRVEAENKVQQERLRISRDLHDNIGSQLTFIISSLDNLKFKLQKDNPEVVDRLEEINQFTRNTINELRDTIWAMGKENISFSDLRIRINNFIENAKSAASDIDFKTEISSEIEESHKFSAFEGINLYRLIQEAINNAVKHSDASEITVKFDKSGDKFRITVSDNGKGIPAEKIGTGNGLDNMKNRILDLGGSLDVDSAPGQGTRLKFSF